MVRRVTAVRRCALDSWSSRTEQGIALAPTWNQLPTAFFLAEGKGLRVAIPQRHCTQTRMVRTFSSGCSPILTI